MDFRYETKNDSRKYHKQRRAFIILDNSLEFLPKNSSKSHYEFCKLKGLSKKKFNSITRGFYLNNAAVFYKDNFIYDDKVISEALNHMTEIANILEVQKFDIYFGVLPDKNFEYDHYYGKYENGRITKSNNYDLNE